MDGDEERFLAAAQKFLSGISRGGPAPSLHFVATSSQAGLYEGPPLDAGRPVSKTMTGEEWLCTHSAAPFVQSSAVLAGARGGAALCAVSVIGYIPLATRKALGKQKSNQELLSSHRLYTKVQSYQHLLPSTSPDRQHGESLGEKDRTEYDPNFLDDPELRTGKHRTVIALASSLGSIIHFTKAEFLKRELNEKFRKLHGDIHPSLTLSQIRNLKTHLLQIGVSDGLELSTIARAYTFLEKLIMKRFVGKSNRKLVGGCCLVLAAKATDAKTTDYKRLFNRLSAGLSVSRRMLVDLEFSVLAALSFRLQVPESQFGSHLTRILTRLDYSNLQEYVGERMYQNWQRTLEEA